MSQERSNLVHTDIRTPPSLPHCHGSDHHEISTPLAQSVDTETQFDSIAQNVNLTIKELNSVYNEIGYSSGEIADKRAEIFQIINDTISQFAQSLEREKSNIENECEWLRQQIRLILAMLNDTSGERTLRLSSRGIVFQNEEMFHEGCKEEVLQHMGKSSMISQLNSFSTNSLISSGEHSSQFPPLSPYSSSEGLFSEITSHQQSKFMESSNTKLSLLQYKARLNSIFLEVLKSFMKIFRKFNEANRLFWEHEELISDNHEPQQVSEFVSSLPNKAQAEEHAALITDFDSMVKQLKLTNRNFRPESRLGFGEASSSVDTFAFIISSPTKRSNQLGPHAEAGSDDALLNKCMESLRDINYKIVTVIRELKFTRISSEMISLLNKEISERETEVERRSTDMKRIIGVCLQLIADLSLSELDVIKIQKMQDASNIDSRNAQSSEGYLDVETLQFIATNPKELGLMDHHIQFVQHLANTLQTLRDNKQRQWSYYSKSCQSLWDKLGENKEFTSQFLAANSNLTDAALSNLKMELSRLLTKRSEFVDSFILDARRQIDSLHEQLLYSELQRTSFKYHDLDITRDDDNEEKELILHEHEKEIESLKQELAAKKPIFDLYQELRELIEDQNFLVESSKDSSRLLSKNSCKILLNEERIRKKINKNLPRVVPSLKEAIVAFNNESLAKGQKTIKIHDTDLFEKVLMMEADLASFAQQKHHRAKQSTRISPVKQQTKLGTAFSRTSPTKITKDSGRNPSPLKLKRPRSSQTDGNAHWHGKSKSLERVPSSAGGHHAQSNTVLKSGSVERPGQLTANNLLRPLNTPLIPNRGRPPIDTGDQFADTMSDSSTLYSMCSRVSPVRELVMGHGFQSLYLPVGRNNPTSHETEDKENFGSLGKGFEYSPSKGGFSTDRIANSSSRLSSGSLANSTIINDDYKQWRDERIRHMNGGF